MGRCFIRMISAATQSRTFMALQPKICADWGSGFAKRCTRGDNRRTYGLVRPPPASAPHRRGLPYNSHSQVVCLLWYTSGGRPGTSVQSLKAWYGAFGCLFRMPLQVGQLQIGHLEGFVDHVRVFDTEFCLSRSRFPAQHQHSTKAG